MAERIINRHRPLRPGALRARYLRLRHAEAPGARELDDTLADEWYIDDEWSWDLERRQDRLDALWQQLAERIAAAVPFNPLMLPAVWGSPSSDEVESHALATPGIDAALATYHDQLPTLDTAALLAAPGIDTDLQHLAQIAQRHLGGHTTALVPLLLLHPFWVRSPRTWSSPKRSRRSTVISLVEHLLLRFPIPAFLLNACATPSRALDTRWLWWAVVMGQGGSLRRFNQRVSEGPRGRDLGWGDLAKKLPACLFEVPRGFAPEDGVALAEVIRLGGSMVEYQWVRGGHGYRLDPTALRANHPERRFWEQTVRWLVRHREQLTDETAHLCLRWGRHRFTERYREPFEWSGRAPAPTVREARRYVQHLYHYRHGRRRWSARGWDWQGQVDGSEWTIQELTSSEALLDESVAMSHCVRLYDFRCVRGWSAIFSVRRDGKRCLTVEVKPGGRRIVQVRGVCNRLASRIEKSIVARWREEILDSE